MLEDFKKFLMRGNVLDMAVGIVIGVAFGAVVTSFLNDLLMPPIGLALGGADFSSLFMVLQEGATPAPYATLVAAQEAGAVTFNYGAFITVLLNFLIVAAAIFMVVRMVANMQKKEEAPAAPTTKDCQFCLSTIAIKATRCPNCTSQLA